MGSAPSVEEQDGTGLESQGPSRPVSSRPAREMTPASGPSSTTTSGRITSGMGSMRRRAIGATSGFKRYEQVALGEFKLFEPWLSNRCYVLDND